MPKLGKPTGGKVLMALAYGYLFLPFLLFVLGWLRWYFALPLAAAVAVCYALMVRHAPEVWTPAIEWRDWKFWARLAAVLAIVAVWVYYSGIGRFTYQTEDHTVRNVIFRMLVEQPWPIVDLNPPAEYFSGPVAFVYYFGFWLPSALVGKAFGMLAGNVAQLLWAMAGVLVFYLLVLSQLKKWRVWPLVVFVFFSGWDWIAASLLKGGVINVWSATPHLDNWPDYFQYSSFSTQLYWVFNQAIVGWVCALLLMVQKNNRAIAPIVGLCLITGTFPAVGLVPLALYVVCRNWWAAHKGQRFQPGVFIKEVLTLENVTGAVCALISYLFLGSNNNGQNFGTLFHIFGDIWWLWLLFVVCEVVVLLALVAKYQWRNPLFYVIGAMLLVIPWLRFNDKADFCMRASIPAFVIIYLWVVLALDKSFAQKTWALFAALVAALIIGSATAETEVVRSIALTRIYKAEGRPVADVEWDPMEVSWRGNFYGYMEGRFFFQYLMKDPPVT